MVGAVMLALAVTTSAAQQDQSGIAGRVTRQDGSPLGGVMVVVKETGAIHWTTADGRYRVALETPGSYTLLISLGPYSIEQTASVISGETSSVETKVDWPLAFIDTVVVTSASRLVESLAAAPAAVTTLDAVDVARQSTSGQLPLLLASAPGAQAAQSGLYDFNVNARGFNDTVNRRVRMEVDGRDTSMPFLSGYTDWATLAFGLGEVDQVEFLRGPGGALYGVGALNGVISVRTRAPADSLGGTARFTFGQLDTMRVDARQAVAIGSSWYLKVVGGAQRSADFARSRAAEVEYAPGVLPTEAAALVRDRPELALGGVRLDRQLRNGNAFVVEGGTVSKTGQVTLTNLGRNQWRKSSFPWMRAAFQSSTWNVLAAYTTAKVRSLALASGQEAFTAGSNLQVDAHTNGTFREGRGRWVAGGSYSLQRINSADDQGVETVFASPQTAKGASAFGQVDYTPVDRLKITFAGRVDASTLNRLTASPRAAIVYEVTPQQHARLVFSRAYKAPTMAELLLQAQIAPPLDLSRLESALAPLLGGTSLGFGYIPVLAVGNQSLDVEAVTGVEAGYNVLLGGLTFLQATYYRNRVNTFTSGLLPQVGTTLGRLNPAFEAYRAPSTLSPAAAAAVYGALAAALPPSLLASMSNLPNGSPVLAVLTLANFGEAVTRGVELGVTAQATVRWRIDASYAWFDSSIDRPPDVPLLPNAPRHQGALGVVHVSPKFNTGVRARFVGGFDWSSGVYAGPVPSYGVVDLQANYAVNTRFSVGFDVSNVLDNAHYEMFGGDLLRRRALVHTTVNWPH